MSEKVEERSEKREGGELDCWRMGDKRMRKR
jgi:hypothetical protein